MFKDNSGVLFALDDRLTDWIRAIRRRIHSYPELSFDEHETSRFIAEKLDEIGISHTCGTARTGIVAEIAPPGRKGGDMASMPGVALRADMDALPVQEETGLDFASTRPGLMHACGHDGHIAMLLGAAALLSRREVPGMVRLLFQPAEEHGNGAQDFTAAGVLDGIDEVYAGHIDTHYPLGSVTVDEGVVCAWSDPFTIRVRGRSGHAARPHEAVDAIVAAANLVVAAQSLVSRGADPNRATVVTIGTMEAGTACNIIADSALLQGTIRATDEQTRRQTMKGLQRMVEATAMMHRVECELQFSESVPAVCNARRAVENARVAASRTQGLNSIISQGAPSLGAEDFSFYQQTIPGCLVRFGSAKTPAAGVAHSPTFDFDERVLALGASWYANVAWQSLCRRLGWNSEFAGPDQHGPLHL